LGKEDEKKHLYTTSEIPTDFDSTTCQQRFPSFILLGSRAQILADVKQHKLSECLLIFSSLKLLGSNISGEPSVKELKRAQICSQLYQYKSKLISDRSVEVSQHLAKIKVHPAHLIPLPAL